MGQWLHRGTQSMTAHRVGGGPMDWPSGGHPSNFGHGWNCGMGRPPTRRMDAPPSLRCSGVHNILCRWLSPQTRGFCRCFALTSHRPFLLGVAWLDSIRNGVHLNSTLFNSNGLLVLFRVVSCLAWALDADCLWSVPASVGPPSSTQFREIYSSSVCRLPRFTDRLHEFDALPGGPAGGTSFFTSLHEEGNLLWSEEFYGGKLIAPYKRWTGAMEIQSTHSAFAVLLSGQSCVCLEQSK